MRQTFNVSFYCRNSKVSRKGVAPIELSLSINSKRSFIALPRKMTPSDFSKDMASKRVNDTKEFCKSYEIKVNECVKGLLEYGKPITTDSVKTALINGVATSYLVSEIFKNQLGIMAERTKCGTTYGTYRKYELSYDLFLKCIGDKDINSVTASDIERFISFVNTEHQAATSRGYVLRVKSAFIQARQDGKLNKDPFIGIKVKNPRKKLEIITEEEYKAIREKRFSTPRLEKVRKLFVLGCNCGLAYCDMIDLSKDDVQEKDGVNYICKQRRKTGVEFTSVVLEDGIDVLSELDDLKMSNQKVNCYLKEIQDICGIQHTLTFHKSRHFYITHLLRMGIPTSVVQKCVGHSSIQMTAHYTHLLKDDVLNAFKQ